MSTPSGGQIPVPPLDWVRTHSETNGLNFTDISGDSQTSPMERLLSSKPLTAVSSISCVANQTDSAPGLQAGHH